MSTASFQGFGPKALPFFRALDFHQDRAWFAENRAIYDADVLGPLGAFVADLSAACAARGLPLRGSPKGSIFRIHRDVRFSKDKRPYKTHAGALLTRSGAKTDPGCFYIHIAPEGCFCAAGFYDLEPPRLAAVRQALVEGPQRFAAMAETLAAAGHALDRRWSLTRPPREAAGIADPALVEALKLKSYLVTRPIEAEAIAGPGLVADCAGFVEEALPLLRFGWDVLDRLEPERG
ncbi:DUF2461 domain-containing protein [Labrys wisconsinensis]|uniref:Uncharacterized protein (TIGR02453 family) n=1 Tax=Labrys wisconsinensis TaxID=425677 RepID=A0ABU0JHT1_9HYPH|nr:TIGR02453 family protein [Labrys wisconsinensis]MDQ0473842.1 uncharacterized protein (TIGR02453 family) [Labrys wisconsinensis]